PKKKAGKKAPAAEAEMNTPEQSKPKRQAGPKTPLFKKELSFKRRPKAKRPLDEGDEPKKAKKSKRGSRRQGSGQKRAKRLVGLKIGASQIAAARVVNNGSPELVQVAREDIDHGLIVGRELREP